METKWVSTVPVLPSADLTRDIAWYLAQTGFECIYQEVGYAVLHRENLNLHLQWHADTVADPLLGGSVVKIFIRGIAPLFEEFVKRGTVQDTALNRNTPWNTHEFGFYDLNSNALFFVESL